MMHLSSALVLGGSDLFHSHRQSKAGFLDDSYKQHAIVGHKD